MRQIATSAPEASFTRVPRLAVDSQGRIYIPDNYQQKVSVLSPDGDLLRALGRRGDGPGEFRAIQSVQILPADSLLVYDPSLGRISVFAPDADRPAYMVTLANKLPGAPPWQVQRTHQNDALVALFRPRFAFVPGADFTTRVDRVRLLALDGEPRKDLLSFPSRSVLVEGTWITPHPLGNGGLFRLDSRDRLHYAWTDTLAVAMYDLDGERVGGFQLPYSSPPISRVDAEVALEGLGGQAKRHFASIFADSTPERWPAISDLLLDDRDRVWMALAGSTTEPTEWVAFSPEGSYLASVMIPAGSSVRLIRADGTVYAERLDDDDVPSVVVYRMDRPLR